MFFLHSIHTVPSQRFAIVSLARLYDQAQFNFNTANLLCANMELSILLQIVASSIQKRISQQRNLVTLDNFYKTSSREIALCQIGPSSQRQQRMAKRKNRFGPLRSQCLRFIFVPNCFTLQIQNPGSRFKRLIPA